MKGRRVVIESVGKAVLKEFDVPEPGPGEVLIEHDYTAVSAGTERANLMGLPNTSAGFPYYPGYCGVGRAIALGEGVENVRIGDRVLSAYGGGHRTHAIEKAPHTVVRDERVESLDAAFVRIAAMGVGGLRRVRLELGESAMVVGLGLLGMFAVQSAALSGGVPVIVSDFDKKRRDLALTLGADYAFSPDEENLPEEIRELTGGRGVDAIVEVTGASVALQQALTFVRREGRVSLLGCTRVSDANIDFYKYVHCPGVRLLGAHNLARPRVDSRPGCWTQLEDFRVVLALLATGKMQVGPMISEVVSPECAPSVYDRLAHDKNPPLGVAFDWSKLR